MFTFGGQTHQARGNEGERGMENKRNFYQDTQATSVQHMKKKYIYCNVFLQSFLPNWKNHVRTLCIVISAEHLNLIIFLLSNTHCGTCVLILSKMRESAAQMTLLSLFIDKEKDGSHR